MKTLIPRATKGIDQEAMGSVRYGSAYVPLENHQTWTTDFASAPSGLGIVTVYACIRILAETIASLPLITYRRLPNGGKERAFDHPLYRTFHDQPNPAMTSLVWRELLVSHIAGWGNHFSEIAFDGFGQMQFWPIRPDRMEALWDSDGRKVYDYLSPSGGRKRMRPGTVFHVPGLSPDGLRGYSPIALHRKAIRLYETAQEYGTNFLANGARPATVLSHPRNLSDPAISRLANQMDDLRGSRNSGKTVILEEGMTITEVGVPPEEAQYIETRKFQMQEIARMYRIPPHMIGDLERATFSNIEHQSIDFVVHTIRPWLVRIEQEIKAQLIVEDDISVEFLVDGLLRGDAESRAKALMVQRQNGVINAREWRAIENLNPLEDESDLDYWRPVNMTVAGGEAETEQAEEEMPAPFTVVKSAAVRCQKGHLLAELATPPYRFTCSKCKSVTEAEAEPPAVKSVETIYDYDPDGRVKRTVELAS